MKLISRVLQELLRYFYDIIISASFVPQFPVWAVISALKLNESVALAVPFTVGITLQCCINMFFNNYHYILLSYTLRLLYQCI